jgi:hypothetical protein
MWYLVVGTHTFIPTLWFWRERREALFLLPSGDFWSIVKLDEENIMKDGLED